jgi:universal stress protein E
MSVQQTRLFVIVDPTADHQVALVKALLIAKLGRCHIHAFLCTYKDLEDAGQYQSRKDFKQRSLDDADEWLKQLMQPCEISGVPYTTEVVWNSKWVDAALRSIEKSGCDLVIKSSFQHNKARRFFSKTSDYHLMHYCASPILFTHQDQDWQSDRILACLDLESADSQHARLNGVILHSARAFADIVGMDLYIACAYQERIDSAHLQMKGHEGEISREHLAEAYNLDPARIILRRGSTIETLQEICDDTDPCIVMIGTLARKGISGKLIGNTAEKLLDLIEGDLLTVN